MHNILYPSDWKLRVAACLARAAYRCEDCGGPHGVLSVGKRSKSPYIVYLHAAHVNHDPENPWAELRAWQIGDLNSIATDVLDAIGSALHCLMMEWLEEVRVKAIRNGGASMFANQHTSICSNDGTKAYA